MAKKKNVTYNFNGEGQVTNAYDHSTIIVTQNNNGKSVEQLDTIIKGIKDNLSELKEKDAKKITKILNKTKKELAKSKPQVGRLRKYISLIAPMFTIANGIPVLMENLKKLTDYIQTCIK